MGILLETLSGRWLPEQISCLKWRQHPKLSIRVNGKPQWTEHPSVDVAAMRVIMPPNLKTTLLPTTLLATDSLLTKYEIRPGDELQVLGYPYGAESNKAGFPILRSGRIASYPLTPTKETQTFLMDFEVFKGNSGGPVFFYEDFRRIGNQSKTGDFSLLLGLVSLEQNIREEVRSISETVVKEHRLALAVVIHAHFIREVVELLPPPTELTTE